MQRAVIVIAIMIFVVTEVATGRADPASADRAAAEAEARVAAKDYVGAAAKFREAYAADPRPDFICNVGVAYYKAQELTRAQLFLNRCLERGSSLDGKFMDVVRGTLAKLEGTLKSESYTPIDIVVEPRFATVAISSFAADETFDGGRTLWLPFGTYRVTVRAEGYLEQTVDISAVDRAVLPVRVTLVKEPVLIRQSPQDHHEVVKPGPEPVARAKPSLVPAIATSAATLALAVFAVIASGDAHDHADRAGFALRDAAFQTEADAARRWNTIFGIDVAITGVTAVASGYLWYRATRHPGPAVEVSSHGAAVMISGRF